MAGTDELASSLAATAARLREIGDDALTRELSQAIGDAVAPLKDRIRAGLKPHLPDPYAEVLGADLKIRRSSSRTGEEARVSVLASADGIKKRKLAQSDAGILNHPLFGRFPRLDPRNRWFGQGAPSVRPGWFSDPVEESVPDVREAVERALDNVAEKAVGKGS